MQYKIDKAMPIPPMPQGREAKYPWEQLEPAKQDKKSGQMIGPSFAIPDGKASVVSSANKRYKEHGKKFTSRNVEEGGKKVLRVWRIQ